MSNSKIDFSNIAEEQKDVLIIGLQHRLDIALSLLSKEQREEYNLRISKYGSLVISLHA